MPERLSFNISSLTNLEDDARFASLMNRYVSTDGVSYLGFTFHATAPEVNYKGMAITYPTHKRSAYSAKDKLVDLEHTMEDINAAGMNGKGGNELLGHICDLYIDDEDIQNMEWLVEGIIPKKPILTRGILAAYPRIQKAKDIIEDIRKDRDNWYFSLEVGENVPPPEIWLFDDKSHDILSWADADDDLRNAARQPREVTYKGKRVAYLMGGRDGLIPYIGGALTQSPAGKEQIEENKVKFICNWMGEDADEKRFAIYSSLADVPDNLKTMDKVPLTLSQINGIVRQAEGIEKDGGGANGWAVAKAHFKKAHYVKDGMWVEREMEKKAAAWTTAYMNSLPDSSFAVIEGDYKSGKTDNKNCRHLPFKDANGKVDLPHLRKALARMNQVKPASGPESASELQAKAKRVLERYRKYLTTEKKAAGDYDNEIAEEELEVVILSMAELREFVDVIDEIKGGIEMPDKLELTEEELEQRVAGRVKEKLDSGEYVPKTALEGLFNKEQVDAMVKDAETKVSREKSIAAIGADEETTKEWSLLAVNKEIYPYDADGEKKFASAVERWKKMIAKEKPKDGEGADKGTASLGDNGKNFDPGSGNGDTGNAVKPIRRIGMN